MNRRALALVGILVLVIILAFVLRDVVTMALIVPLAYIWWIIKIYYAAIPQAIFWGLVAALVFYSAVMNLIPKIDRRAARKEKILPARGHIETLADQIEKSDRGMYYKWLVANRLGKNAREILSQRDGNPIGNKFGPLSGRNWMPPREIETYLDSGLNGSFAEFSRRRWFWQKRESTPLDVKAQEVIDYLEDEMKI